MDFKLGIFAATGAVLFVYVATFVLRLFGTDVPFTVTNTPGADGSLSAVL